MIFDQFGFCMIVLLIIVLIDKFRDLDEVLLSIIARHTEGSRGGHREGPGVYTSLRNAHLAY
jgi:hypothetical protein